MTRPARCPQCHTDRVWARAVVGGAGATRVAFCPNCARAAALCSGCGSELMLARQASWAWGGRPRVESVLQCPACRRTEARLPQPVAQPPGDGAELPRPWGASPAEPPATPRGFTGTPAPPLMQRVADDIEEQAADRYVRRRQLVGMVAEAARRADAVARLEASLVQLGSGSVSA